MKRKATIQKQAMIEALKPRYIVLEWDGGYNLYDTTKPARQTNYGDFVAQIYLNNDYSKYVYNKKRYDSVEDLSKAIDDYIVTLPFYWGNYDPSNSKSNGSMKKVKVITSTKELEAFLERTDIDIIKTEVRGCEQSWFAQEYFVATIYYDDKPKKEDIPDYWEKLLHQYAGMAMQGILSNQDYCKLLIDENQTGSFADDVSRCAKDFATVLVNKLKEENNAIGKS